MTGASSGLGRGLGAGLADRGMSLVLTGRNEARLDETAHQQHARDPPLLPNGWAARWRAAHPRGYTAEG